MNNLNMTYRHALNLFYIDQSTIYSGRRNYNFISFLAKIILLNIFISLYSFPVLFSQTPAIDSLKISLADSQSDKLTTLFELCQRGESMPADSLMKYAQKAKQLSIQKNDTKNSLEADFFIAKCYNLKGRADTSLIICNKGLQQIKDINSSFPEYRDFMWFKIVSLTKLRKLKESIDECYKLLEAGEEHNDILAQGIATNCLGVNNNVLLNRAEALNWFNKAFLLVGNYPSNRIYLQVMINLSAVYFYHNKLDSGFYFLNRAMAEARIRQNLKTEADCYTLRGLIYSQQNKTDSAEQQLQKAVTIQKQIGNVQYILVGLDALETFYDQQKNYLKAIEYIKLAEDYSRKYHEPLVFQFYLDLAECYKQLKDYKSYGETLDTLMTIKDSLYQKSKAEDLAKLEAQYDVSSKETFIAKQKLELLHKNILIAGITLITLLTAAIVLLIYRRNKRRQKITLTAAEEKERRRIAADLHDNIGAYASAISAGIDEIENKNLISDTSAIHYLKTNATEIITSLRDTIWAFNKESITLTGIGDRIKIYVQKIHPAYPFIAIAIEENIRVEKRLSPFQALDIFRIVQEALHNALRHSHCNKILISIISNGEGTIINIEDDGKGFVPATALNTGNGIMNMKNRAANAGFNLVFINLSSKGTNVRLSTGKL